MNVKESEQAIAHARRTGFADDDTTVLISIEGTIVDPRNLYCGPATNPLLNETVNVLMLADSEAHIPEADQAEHFEVSQTEVH